MKKFVLISGSSNTPLAQKVASNLNVQLCAVEIEKFANYEQRIRILEEIKNKTAIIIQSTSQPAGEYILELAFIADALKRADVEKIIAIMPWFGYSPQDKIFRNGESLSSAVVVQMLESTPIDEFCVIDIHSPLVLKMFQKPIHHLSAISIFVEYFKNKLSEHWVAVALDKGALERATEFSEALSIPLVIFDKSRDKDTGEVSFHSLSGEVRDKNVISFDDFIGTGGTRIKGAAFLKENGALKYYDCVTHLLVPKTLRKIEESKIDRLFLTDSIAYKASTKKLTVLSIAPLVASFINKYIS